MKEIINKYFEAFNKGDVTGMLSLLDESVIHEANQGKTRHGKKAFEDFLAHMNHSYKEEIKDLVVMVSENGVNASAEFMVHGTYLKTDSGLPEAKNQKYVIRAGSFFEAANNKITRVTTFYNLPHWIELVK